MSTLKTSLKVLALSVLYIQSSHCFQGPEFNNQELAALTQLQNEKIDARALFIPNGLGNISVYHDENGFKVENSLGSSKVQPCFIDKELRGISKTNLAKLIATGSYLSVNKLDGCNEYSLKLKSRLMGGGLLGASAGFYVGTFVVNFLGHGAILVAGALTGPAAPATILALEATFGGIITAAGTAAGVGCGIAAGVATGPV